MYLSKLSLIGFVIFLPFRWRLLSIERPLPPVYFEYRDFAVYASDVFVLLYLFTSLWSRIRAGRPMKLGPAWLIGPLLLLPLAGGLSSLSSVDPPFSIYNSLRLLMLTGFVIVLFNNPPSSKLLAAAFSIMLLLQAGVGITQFLSQASIGLGMVGERVLDLDYPGISRLGIGTTYWMRAYGLTDHPNILGGLLAVALLSSILLLIRKPIQLSGGYAIHLAVFAIGAAALYASFSRSAWLGLIIGVLLIVWLLWRDSGPVVFLRLMPMFIAAALAIWPVYAPTASFLRVRILPVDTAQPNKTETKALSDRRLLMGTALGFIRSQPLTGIGLGGFPTAVKVLHADHPRPYQPVHIVLVDAAAETGVIGLVPAALALVAPAIILLANRKSLDWTPSLIGACAGLLTLAVIGLFDYYPWMLAPGRGMQWLLWGLFGSHFLHSAPEPNSPGTDAYV